MTDKNILVSICIPAYNAEKYILDAVNSIFLQSYSNIELIVVNDGSTDNTEKILENINDSRLKVISSTNKGQCSAANLAFKNSKGELIKFMDADDLISPEFIEKQVAVLNGDMNKIASAEWGRFHNNDLSTFTLRPELVWRNMKPIDWLVESLSSGPNMMQCGLWLIPRTILAKSGLWDERLSLINDFDFIIRVLLQSTEIKFTPNSVLYYRSGISNSLSAQKTRKAYESACLSTQMGCNSILNFENSSRTRKVCANSYQYWVYNCYPSCIDLSKNMEKMSMQFGKSDLKYPAGGLTKLLSKFIGWKLTANLKSKIHIKTLKLIKCALLYSAIAQSLINN